MITSKFSVIAILIITGICFGVLYIHIWKEKGSCSGQYCLYWNYVCAVSDTAADWQFSAYMLGVVAAFLVMYVQDRRNIYQKIFLAVTFFLSVGLRLQWQTDWMILSQKLWFLGIRLQEDNGCNMDFMLEREFWILCFVSFSLQLQSVWSIKHMYTKWWNER